MATPEAAKLGLGDVDDGRLGRSIAIIAESYGLANPPTPGRVFDRQFLPPAAERKLPR
jgi:NitT/TauT family transport system substrate-binding protein